LNRLPILGVHVSAVSYEDTMAVILAWARSRQSRYVCLGTVNQVMEAHDSAEFREVMNQADLVTPDGMPLVWGLRLLGQRRASRVYGPDLMPLVLEKAEREGIPVGFYGVTQQVLDRLTGIVRTRYPKLQIAYAFSPPFRPLTFEEDTQVVSAINASGVRILFIGLGNPKQEKWMAAHRGPVQAVMVGVGAAFDFLAGSKRQAPRWMMPLGLEWLFRLCTEPRRLWKRYLKHNPRFLWLFTKQLLQARRQKSG
jgi:N-acetylglucosaminyldiphosphoundecaprenol N-acetyl-beta-D-mannosaminyltransferase